MDRSSIRGVFWLNADRKVTHRLLDRDVGGAILGSGYTPNEAEQIEAWLEKGWRIVSASVSTLPLTTAKAQQTRTETVLLILEWAGK